MDNLKKPHEDSAEEQLLQQQQREILPALQRQLALGIADSAAAVNIGQREDEEQLILHSTANNKNEEKEENGEIGGSVDSAPVLKVCWKMHRVWLSRVYHNWVHYIRGRV